MNIEAKQTRSERMDRTGEPDGDTVQPLVAAFARYRDQYEAALGIRSVAALRDRVAIAEDKLNMTLTPATVADFAYLSVFPALRTATFSDHVPFDKDTYEKAAGDAWYGNSSDVHNADVAVRKWLEGHAPAVLGGGLDKTGITKLVVYAQKCTLALSPAMAPTVAGLAELSLNGALRFSNEDPLPTFAFSSLRNLSLGVHYSVNYGAFVSYVGKLAWCGTVPTLESLRLENVAEFWFEGAIDPDAVFPNLKSFTLYYCNAWDIFPRLTMSALERLTLFHTSIHGVNSNILTTRYPALKHLDWAEDEIDQVNEETRWNHDHFRAAPVTLDSHATLKTIRIQYVKPVLSLRLRGSYPSLKRVDLQHTTSELEFTPSFEIMVSGESLRARFLKLTHVLLDHGNRNERFSDYLLHLPALVEYTGPLSLEHIDVNDLDSPDIPVVDSPYHHALFAQLVAANPNHLLFSDVYGAGNVPDELQTLYSKYKKQYAVAGFPTLVLLLRFRRYGANPFTLPLHPALLADFAYLAFFADRHNIVFKDSPPEAAPRATKSPPSFVLGPGLKAALPRLENFIVESKRHVLRDIDVRCFVSPGSSSGGHAAERSTEGDPSAERSVPMNFIILNCRIHLKRPVEVPVGHSWIVGTLGGDSHLANLSASFAKSIQMFRVADAASLDIATSFPAIEMLTMEHCALPMLPATWASSTLETLACVNVPLRLLADVRNQNGTTPFAERFPELRTLRIENVAGVTENAAEFNEVVLWSVDFPPRLQRLVFRNVAIRALDVERRQTGADALIEIMLDNALMVQAPPTILNVREPRRPSVLRTITWDAPNGYMPEYAMMWYGQSEPTAFNYTGTYIVNPSMLRDGVLHLDAYRAESIMAAYTADLFEILVAANPGMDIRSEVRDRWVAMHVRSLGAMRNQRVAPYFIAFRHSLICRRNATLEALAAAMAYDATSIEMWAAVEALEMVSDEGAEEEVAAIVAGTEGSAMARMVAKARAMETARAARLAPVQQRLDAAMAALNAHPTAGIRDAAAAGGTFRATLGDRTLSFELVTPYFDTECTLCANRFYPTEDTLSTSNAVLLANKDALAVLFASDADGRARGPLVTCNFTQADYVAAYPEKDVQQQLVDEFICSEHVHFFHEKCYAHTLLSMTSKRCPFSSKKFVTTE